MTKKDVEIILQRAREKHSQTTLRMSFDKGPAFIAKDCQEFIRVAGKTPARPVSYDPGKGNLQPTNSTGLTLHFRLTQDMVICEDEPKMNSVGLVPVESLSLTFIFWLFEGRIVGRAITSLLISIQK
jgi:hypothetical protein